jgi:hypothetical protein
LSTCHCSCCPTLVGTPLCSSSTSASCNKGVATWRSPKLRLASANFVFAASKLGACVLLRQVLGSQLLQPLLVVQSVQEVSRVFLTGESPSAERSTSASPSFSFGVTGGRSNRVLFYFCFCPSGRGCLLLMLMRREPPSFSFASRGEVPAAAACCLAHHCGFSSLCPFSCVVCVLQCVVCLCLCVTGGNERFCLRLQHNCRA